METEDKARKLVERHVLHNLCLTIDRELKNNPEVLYKSKNYFRQDEEGNPDEDGEYPDIFEFWAVSDWLYNRLEENGEVVFEALDFFVWSRQCTGQAIYMDSVIKDIAEKYL